MISSLAEAVELIDDVDKTIPRSAFSSTAGMSWNTPAVAEEIEPNAKLFVGVHIADWSEATRGWV